MASYPPRRGTVSACQGGEHRCTGTPLMAYVRSRVPHPSWAFALLSFFPPTIVFFLLVSDRSTFLYFLFFQSFLLYPVLPNCFARTSSPKSSWACPLEVPSPAYFSTFLYPFLPCTSFFSCISLSRTSLRSRTSHVCLALSLPKSSWACPFWIPPSVYFLSFTLPSCTSLYRFYHDFPLLCRYCVFLHYMLYWNFPEKFICHWLLFCLFL